MIYTDGSSVKVGGVLLPGVFKSIEIKNAVQLDIQMVEGSASSKKQVSGYEDAKITLELLVDDSPDKTKAQKLEVLQNIFRKKGQVKPYTYNIVNEHTARAGINIVIFESLTIKANNMGSSVSASLEFLQYDAAKLVVTKATTTATKKTTTKKATTKKTAEAPKLDTSYEKYLTGRGAAPKLENKTGKTSLLDNGTPFFLKVKDYGK